MYRYWNPSSWRSDEMLNMGFLEISKFIISVSRKFQTYFFSKLCQMLSNVSVFSLWKKPVLYVKIAAKELTTELVDQYHIRVMEQAGLTPCIPSHGCRTTKVYIVFGQNNIPADELTRGLNRISKERRAHGDWTKQTFSCPRDFKNGTQMFWLRRMGAAWFGYFRCDPCLQLRYSARSWKLCSPYRSYRACW